MSISSLLTTAPTSPPQTSSSRHSTVLTASSSRPHRRKSSIAEIPPVSMPSLSGAKKRKREGELDPEPVLQTPQHR
jgi:hypothetical protein